MKTLLEKDIARLENAIQQLKDGYIGTDAAKLRYIAAMVSRSAINANLPRKTRVKWDIDAEMNDKQFDEAIVELFDTEASQ